MGVDNKGCYSDKILDCACSNCLGSLLNSRKHDAFNILGNENASISVLVMIYRLLVIAGRRTLKKTHDRYSCHSAHFSAHILQTLSNMSYAQVKQWGKGIQFYFCLVLSVTSIIY